MTKISVIMATYNRATTLPRAIDSILKQTIEDIELVIVDDGSTDSTPELLSEYACKDKRIKIITQKNHGLAIARNNGVAKASSEYICFMDSDDACAVNRLEAQLDFLLENPQFSACCLINLGQIDDYFPGIMGDKTGNHVGYFCSIFQQYNWQRAGVLGPHSFMTKESFLSLGGYRPDNEVIEDLDFTMRYYSSQYNAAALLNNNLYFYEYPETNSQANLTNNDIHRFTKRFAASLICEWCRHKGLEDPLDQGKDLEGILAIKSIMPWKDNAVIYNHLHYYRKIISIINNISHKESKKLVIGLVSNNFLERAIIDFWFKWVIRRNHIRANKI